MSDVAIRVEHLGKQYRLGGQQVRYATFRDTLVNAAKAPLGWLKGERRAQPTSFWALDDVSFEVKHGEAVGIIGRNGAGKSTMLKVLSRITSPTRGRVDIYGRVGSLLEVGTGFHPELTGRENIFLNGAILGMTRREIMRKFDEIVAFAEIEKFLDTAVKFYSSGMYVRLAFAVAAHLEPEILVVDEVLAVGDAAFQKKSLGKMGDVAKGGRTVLFVSHNMASIRQLCPGCFWIDNGRIKQVGQTSEVIDSYLRESDKSKGLANCIFPENTDKEFQLRIGRLVNEEGIVTQQFDCDKAIIIELECQVHRRIPGLYGYLSITGTDGTTVLVSDSFDVIPNPLDELPVGLFLLRITIPARTLGHGEYAVSLNFTSSSSIQNFNVDSPGKVLTFHLNDQTSQRGNDRNGYFSTLLPWTVSRL